MGASPQQPLDLKGMVLETKDSSRPSGSFWRKVLETKAKNSSSRMRQKQQMVLKKKKKKKKKSMAHLRDSRRPTSEGIQRKVRTLKSLVPNTHNSMGLDGLFRETADYILSLQMRVQVMQIMVKVLSDSDT